MYPHTSFQNNGHNSYKRNFSCLDHMGRRFIVNHWSKELSRAIFPIFRVNHKYTEAQTCHGYRKKCVKKDVVTTWKYIANPNTIA